MPSEAEIEAAEKALDSARLYDCTDQQIAEAALTAAEKVREALTEPETGQEDTNRPIAGSEAAAQVEQPQHKDTENRAEVEEARVIPDEAVEAAERELDRLADEVCGSVDMAGLTIDTFSPYRAAVIALRAALPHLEAAIRADERAKVRKRISELRGGSPEYSQGVADALVAVME